MLGKLKKSEAGWYILSKSQKNVIFGEPIMVRHVVKDQNHSILSKLEEQTVSFELVDDLAVLNEPDQPELIYCYCGHTIKCDCSPLN
jgi:hypothetical protein